MICFQCEAGLLPEPFWDFNDPRIWCNEVFVREYTRKLLTTFSNKTPNEVQIAPTLSCLNKIWKEFLNLKFECLGGFVGRWICECTIWWKGWYYSFNRYDPWPSFAFWKIFTGKTSWTISYAPESLLAFFFLFLSDNGRQIFFCSMIQNFLLSPKSLRQLWEKRNVK